VTQAGDPAEIATFRGLRIPQRCGFLPRVFSASPARANLGASSRSGTGLLRRSTQMTKPHRNLKKANHGARPANAKARRAKRRVVKT
jgi:hypothetical protein